MNWASCRKHFPALSRFTYLNTAGGCPISVEAAAAGKQYFDEILEAGDTHWPRWVQRVEDVRRRAAEFLNADTSEIAFVPTASLGTNLIAQTLAKPGHRVLSAAKEFPSATLPWLNQGAEISFLELEGDGSVNLAAADSLIDSKTIAFVASHVQYHTGYRYDLDALRQLCDAHGLRLILDATQSVGAYPIDVRRYQIDALVFSGYKWTTAGYGIAGLYVKRELLVSSPFAIVGWRSARLPYDMIYDRLDLTDEARALEAGHPLFPGIFALGASLSLIREIGVHRIAKRISELTDVLHRHLKAAGYTISSPQQPDHRSSITLIGMKDAKAVAERLLERGVFVSFFENNLRVSLHFYNNEDDIDALLTHLRDFEELI